jgi:hypothetical protein
LENNVVKVIDMYKTHADHDIAFMVETHNNNNTQVIFCESPKEKATWFKLIQETVNAAKIMSAPIEDEVKLDFSEIDPKDFAEKDIRSLVPILLGPKGLRIKSHKSKLKVYKNCFTGKELIDWLMTNTKIKDRNTALAIGKMFITFGYVKHVSDGIHMMSDIDRIY